MTTNPLTSVPDAVNHRWRGSRHGDNGTVCRDDLMLEQHITVAGREQRQVALNCVEARSKPGSQECKVLHQKKTETQNGGPHRRNHNRECELHQLLREQCDPDGSNRIFGRLGDMDAWTGDEERERFLYNKGASETQKRRERLPL